LTRCLYHTKPTDAWATDIVPRLPADLDVQARALGAYQRRRAFATPSDLLRGLLQYALADRSLAQLGIWGVLSDLAELAPASWLERLQLAKPWLRWLLARLLAAPVRPRWLSQRVRGRVLLVDATTLGLAQGPADAWRLHLAYDLLAGCLDQLHLTDRHGAERLHHYQLQPGDLVVADGGYGRVADLAYAQSRGAAVALRIHLPSFPLQQANGQPFDLRARLARLGPSQTTLSASAYVVHDGQRIAVRVIAGRLPREQQGAALRRFGERARRKGRTPTAERLLLATWLVVVTTLDATSWPAAQVVALYRLRWQVELRIKRLKQLVTGNRLRSRTPANGEALLWAQLVGWALHEPIAQELRAPLTARPSSAAAPPAVPSELSGWQLSVLVLDSLRQAVAGHWDAARVQSCLPRLRRYLVQRQRRDRPQQESAALAWLGGLTPPDWLPTSRHALVASGFS
jgi:hypothetical protein